MRYGFENEYFVMSKGQYVICPAKVPMDECGWLAEARGKPHTDPLEAAYSLLADEKRLRTSAKENKVKLATISYAELSPELRREARRVYGKRNYPEGRGNIYGLDFDAKDEMARAGMHIHFSDFRVIKDEKGSEVHAHSQMNMPKIIRALDQEFEQLIKDTKRLPGFYEMKGWGFEYRSLPNTVDPVYVAEFLARSKF